MSDKMQGSEVTMLDMIERERKQQGRAFAAEQERDQLRADLAAELRRHAADGEQK